MKQTKNMGAKTIRLCLVLWTLWIPCGCAGTEVGNPEIDDANDATGVENFGSEAELESYLLSIREWLFSPISALGENFNPRNMSIYSCG